ncbi:MAG: DMT family transporter [Candidatus Bipolaricaulota bacterium]|nr:DMT family transporter [Candidatus Bipolaricaulota bacterium]MDW8111587.1 DMT family transporter [Candidatus Bipolaricaulota bacterium]
MSRSSERTVELLLLMVVGIWGTNFILMKWVFREISPLAFNAVRMTIAALALGLVWVWRERGSWRISATDWLRLWGVGLLGNAFYQVLFVTGLDLTTSGVSSLLISTIPVWAALLAALGRVEAITSKTWLGIGIAFVGIVLVTLGTPERDAHHRVLAKDPLMGNALTLLASLCWAGYTVFQKRLLERHSPLRTSALGLLLGVPGLWVLAWGEVRRQDWKALSLEAWGVIFYAGVISIALAYLIWSLGVQRLGAARTAVFNNLVPVLTFALAFFFLGEPITPLQIVGGAVVLVGVWQTVLAPANSQKDD